jgi:hypothetical protein
MISDMTLNNLTKDDLKSISNSIYQLIATANDRASKLLNQGKINFAQETAIFNQGLELLELAKKIRLILLDRILTDVNSSKQVLENATKKTEEAIEQINNFIKIFDLLAGLIAILGEIVTTINAGGGTAAAIKVLIDGLQEKLA